MHTGEALDMADGTSQACTCSFMIFAPPLPMRAGIVLGSAVTTLFSRLNRSMVSSSRVCAASTASLWPRKRTPKDGFLSMSMATPVSSYKTRHRQGHAHNMGWKAGGSYRSRRMEANCHRGARTRH
jgi:hypothetical protein